MKLKCDNPVGTSPVAVFPGPTSNRSRRPLRQYYPTRLRALAFTLLAVIFAGTSTGCSTGDDERSTLHRWHPLGEKNWNSIFALGVADSSLYLAGLPDRSLSRWNGESWSTMVETDDLPSAILEFNGDLIIAGGFSEVDGIRASRLARWDGSAWSAIATNVDGGVTELFVHEGELYALGSFTRISGVAVHSIARWDGTAWSALEGTPTHGIFDAISTKAGIVAVARRGIEEELGSAQLVLWNGAEWSVWPELPPVREYGGPSIGPLCIHDGDLHMVYRRVAPGDQRSRTEVFRWSDSRWVLVGGEFFKNPTAGAEIGMLRSLDNELYIGGSFIKVGTQDAKNVARWTGGWWEPLSSGLNRFVSDAVLFRRDVVVIGQFYLDGSGRPVSHVARWGN